MSSPKDELIQVGEQTLSYVRQLFQLSRNGSLAQGRIVARLSLEVVSHPRLSTKVFMVLPAENEDPGLIELVNDELGQPEKVDLSKEAEIVDPQPRLKDEPLSQPKDHKRRRSSDSKSSKRAKTDPKRITFDQLLDRLGKILDNPIAENICSFENEEQIRASWDDRGFKMLGELKVRHHLIQGLVVDIAVEKFGSQGAAIEWEAFCQKTGQQDLEWGTLCGWRTSLNQSLRHVKLARFILLLDLNWTNYRAAMRLLKANRDLLKQHGLGPRSERATFQELTTVSEADRLELKATLETLSKV